MTSLWASACSSAVNRPLQQLLDTAYASCGVTVSIIRCIMCGSVTRDQIAAFCISAAAGGAMFVRWWRMGVEGRRRVWSMYGWFSALMCGGSVLGAAAWAVWLSVLVVFYSPSATTIDTMHSQARFESGLSAFVVIYALEFFCLSVSKLLVLHRMTDFAFSQQTGGMTRRWQVGGRVVLVAVVAGNVVGLGGNVAAAVHWKQSADYFSRAAAAYSSNNTDTGNALAQTGFLQIPIANSIQSVQEFCEVLVLLTIVAAFAITGVACAARVRSALRSSSNNTVARRLQRQIIGTSFVVFVTFLLRSVYSTMFALANALQNGDANCPVPCDSPCFNVYLLMQQWLLYTPEFQLGVILISSPLSLLVALWGMTSERTLQLMESSSVSSRRQLQQDVLQCSREEQE